MGLPQHVLFIGLVYEVDVRDVRNEIVHPVDVGIEAGPVAEGGIGDIDVVFDQVEAEGGFEGHPSPDVTAQLTQCPQVVGGSP